MKIQKVRTDDRIHRIEGITLYLTDNGTVKIAVEAPKLTRRNGKLFAGKEEVRAISIDNEWSPADAAMLTLQTETFDLSFDFNPESDLIQNWGAVEWSPKMVLEAVKELIDITDKRVWK